MLLLNGAEMQYSKIIVTVVIILNTLFMAAVLAIFWHTGSEPAALIAAWFAFTTGELWALSSIKKRTKRKLHKGAVSCIYNQRFRCLVYQISINLKNGLI